MSGKHKLRACVNSDLPVLEPLYRVAFPDEDLIPLVRCLVESEDGTFSQVAIVNGDIVGHIVFTMCTVDGHSLLVSLLGPLCVLPDHQKQGIGSSLVRSGFEHCKELGARRVLVLGDPSYYGRIGFRPETGITAPYPLPEEWKDAWQSLQLNEHSAQLNGRLVVPAPWQDPALWGP
ncbi:GNAT family N-acetyltransferase [Roseibium sp. SCP14]|uniref:GNAT family N-acetyltransferase n=1 Tax=Roseibium sp. SCP14 TaxID=3141375 RepID=UPI0033395C97